MNRQSIKHKNIGITIKWYKWDIKVLTIKQSLIQLRVGTIHSTQENYVLWAISHARNKNISHENQKTSILTIKKVKTRLKLLLYVKERLQEKDLQNCEQKTIQQR
jgi:hypothetical protein